MKMETGVFAEREGVVQEVLVSAGAQVDTKQLLMVLADEGATAEDEGATAEEEDAPAEGS
jgi:pyruvate/2-oxoglutarate dehydrogenase complex dihydrolipoamide acyltransferase (E2) component